MKTLAVALVLVGIGANLALAGTVQCSSPSGELMFNNWTYEGGAVPRGPTTKITWLYKGQPIQNLNVPITGTLGEQSDSNTLDKKTIGEYPDLYQTVIYWTQLSYKEANGKVFAEDTVLCKAVKYVGPPRPSPRR